MKILALTGAPEQPLARIRVIVPLEQLAAQHGWSLRVVETGRVRRADLLWADVVVLQRLMGPRSVRLMTWLRRRQRATVYEIDDLLFEPADHLTDARYLREQADSVRECLALATLITTTTPRLAARLKGFGPMVRLVPNYAADAPTNPPSERPNGPFTVLVAASDHQCLQPLAAALRAIQGPQGPRIVAVGPVAQALLDEGVIVERHGLMSRDAFMRLAGSLGNAVGAIPLDDSPFSACKSAVKYFDYAAAGLVSLCSAVPPYADVIDSGRNGLLCDNTAQAWREAIDALAAAPQWRHAMCQAAQAEVTAHHSLAACVEAWAVALQEARQREPGVAATLPQRVGDAVRIWVDGFVGGLRDRNRARRQRRRQARAGRSR